ncbi:23S rRNA (adenine(2030)-N(6))-methyltransferase RlmJ [Falsirhodobacter halotolerans]|uniref:23S rRNA (adenine(2030)-N(6))-methyltransferase RlmJ n=1 Tax=Falsirhodobacter halotolerans TaxID=1146892 RepID=UPI001FCFC1EF|nr:23S rRNA (adenine(2030)-N(6))-methyltransferase RlmJ [Falsirhodobacter halotolerans]MCJ8140286.1 23S rRNA (adenine(2030)-N(6))-methyltransferase RlmJ [Falsirhodobacter halotolerans]
MLSYQHLYHAGNLADVQKHALLCVMLDYMTRKEKPLTYIESHAGRGLYRLDAEESLRTGEAEKGIGALADAFPADHPYRHRLDEVRSQWGQTAYPGSPLLAALSLRDTDPLHLCELHPQEHRILTEVLSPWGAHIHKKDGFQMALALTPPTPRRGMLLIDPPYEVKSDYEVIPTHMANIARKWNVGVLALWYPLLASAAHIGMLAALSERFPDALRHEVRFPVAKAGHRMIGSGMFIVNAPYGTADEARRIDRIFHST